MKAALDHALVMTEALDLAQRPLYQLSGGELQRLFLAQALLASPPLLLLDEPLSGLDAQGRASIGAMLRALCRTQGVTLMMSCHHPCEMHAFADDVVQIVDGRLEARHVAV